MKILSVSFSDLKGGAAKAAYRLHRGLLCAGQDSLMLVGQRSSDDPRVLAPGSNIAKGWALTGPVIDLLPTLLYPGRDFGNWSVNWLYNGAADRINQINPDICHLNWVGNGMLPLSDISKIKCPVVWTFHDMWPFTGGCHYDNNCGKYRTQCSRCPQLKSRRSSDLSRWGWQAKNRAWVSKKYKAVVPSRWMAQTARDSRILKNARIEVIPYGIDSEVYKPVDKKIARGILNLPPDKKIVLFGAVAPGADSRKGSALLFDSLPHLRKIFSPQELELVIFGHVAGSFTSSTGYNIAAAGYLQDDPSMVLLYSAADVLVVPSLQDNLPLTAMESLACGTPVAAFNIGGMPDMIGHKENGYLAEPFDPGDLAEGIRWILQRPDSEVKTAARGKILREFSLERSVNSHLDLYRELLREGAGHV
jgi:glycosyltransferase involved in cell wall biosynthesis